MLPGFSLTWGMVLTWTIRSIRPGQGHRPAAFGAMSMTGLSLCCPASNRMITSEEERLRAMRHMCSALPRAAQALFEQVRQLSCALAERRAVSTRHRFHVRCAAHGVVVLGGVFFWQVRLVGETWLTCMLRAEARAASKTHFAVLEWPCM